MIYSVTYDLKKPGQNYGDLIKKIKTLGTTWAHPCESHWLINTNLNANEIFNQLKPFIDSNDNVLVVKFDVNDYSGWLSKEIWSWIASQKSLSYSYFR